MVNWGGRWGNRCLAELESMNREKRIYRNAGACLDDLWKRVA